MAWPDEVKCTFVDLYGVDHCGSAQVGRVIERASTEEAKPQSGGQQSGRVLEIGVAVG